MTIALLSEIIYKIKTKLFKYYLHKNLFSFTKLAQSSLVSRVKMTFGCFLKSNPLSTNNNHRWGYLKEPDKSQKSVSKKYVGNERTAKTKAGALLGCDHHPVPTFKESSSHKYKSVALLNAATWGGFRNLKKAWLSKEMDLLLKGILRSPLAVAFN